MNAPALLTPDEARPLISTRFTVPGMKCAGCIGKIERDRLGRGQGGGECFGGGAGSAVVDHHVPARIGKAAHEGCADTCRPAGHKNGGAIKGGAAVGGEGHDSSANSQWPALQSGREAKARASAG